MITVFYLIINYTKIKLVQLVKYYRISKLLVENPSCRIDFSSEVTKSILKKNVVIFANNSIYNSTIGSFSYIQKGSRVFNSEIGRFCSIAASVSIAPGIHDISKVTTHPALLQKSTPLPKVFAKVDNIKSCKKVIIGHDVWIGEKAIVLDGVTIGNGAVIASGAVVVKNVDPYSIVGGIPARHIKYRFDKDTIDFLQESEWWNYSDEWFEKNADLMLSSIEFIKYLKNEKKST